MPKFTPKEGSNWGIEVSHHGPDGKIIYRPKGKPVKIKIKMGDAQFHDGTPQSLYFEEPHPRAGTFKGMATILEERGYANASNLRAECKDFKCPPDTTQCCCRCLMFSEPDFVNIPSLLEEHCAKRGFKVLFLPKFHCELNPLEWYGDDQNIITASIHHQPRKKIMSSLKKISFFINLGYSHFFSFIDSFMVFTMGTYFLV